MKKLFLVALVAIFTLSVSAQTKKAVPAKVKAAFEKKFPTAKNVKWGLEGTTEWESEFLLNGVSYSANFDLNGNWMESEYKINEKDIPADVKSTLNKEFAGFKITLSEISETAKGKVYEFGLLKGKTKKEVAVGEKGNLIKGEAKEAKGKEKEEKD